MLRAESPSCGPHASKFLGEDEVLYSLGCVFNKGPPILAGEGVAVQVPEGWTRSGAPKSKKKGKVVHPAVMMRVLSEPPDHRRSRTWKAGIQWVYFDPDLPGSLRGTLRTGAVAILEEFDEVPLSWIVGSAEIILPPKLKMRIRKSTALSRSDCVFPGRSERSPLIRVHATHWLGVSALQQIRAECPGLPWIGLNVEPALPKACMELVSDRRLAGKKAPGREVAVNEQNFVMPHTMQTAGQHGAVIK
jgi:hypothetical protein